jgi:hypothetical protein
MTPEIDILPLTPKPRPDINSPIMNITNLTTDQLHRIIVLKKRIEKLHNKIESIVEGVMPRSLVALKKKTRRMSRAGRAAIAAAVRKRWAKYRGKAAKKAKPARKKRKVSAAVKKKLAAIAKARWAKVKAAGKKAL